VRASSIICCISEFYSDVCGDCCQHEAEGFYEINWKQVKDTILFNNVVELFRSN
jgi:hypothetical protein